MEIFIKKFPIELWEQVASFLPIWEYHRLRSACIKLSAINSIANLKFSAFKITYQILCPKKKSILQKKVKLDVHRFSNFQFQFLCSQMYDDELIKIVSELPDLKAIDPTFKYNYVLRIASGVTPCLHVVEKLLEDPRVNAADFENHAIRSASELGRIEIVARLLAHPKVNPSTCENYPIGMAANNGHTDVVRILMNDKRIDPSADQNYAIGMAVTQNHLDIVQLLISDSRVNPADDENYAIRIACEDGHHEIVKLLLSDKRVDPTADDNYAIGLASKNGHDKVIKLLLQDGRANPAADNNFAIRAASEEGHAKVVQLLLADHRTNPSTYGNFPIKSASSNGFVDVVQLLLSDARTNPASERNYALQMASHNGHYQVVEYLLADERVQASCDSSEALQRASFNGHAETVRLLLQWNTKRELSSGVFYALLLSLIKFRYQVVKEFLRNQRILAKLFWIASILPIIFSILWFLVIPRLSQMSKNANPTFLMAIFVTFPISIFGLICILLASVDAVFV